MQIDVSDMTYVGGQITTYRLSERNLVFYELKLAKPLESYGSKFQVLTPVEHDALNVKLNRSFFGKPKLKIDSSINDDTKDQIDNLANKIHEFSWTTQAKVGAWPTEVESGNVLLFKCKQVDLDKSTLELIRQTHLELLKNITRVSA